MESNALPHKNYQSILIAGRMGAPLPISNIPTVQISIKLWSEIPLLSSPKGSLFKIPTPLSVLQHFIPCIDLKLWKNKGLLLLRDLYQDASLHTYETLSTRFDLPQPAQFTYLQVRSFLHKHPLPLHLEIPVSMYTFFLEPTSPLRGISLFYNIYNTQDPFSKTTTMLKWEEALGKTFTDTYWVKALSTTYTSSKCINHWEHYQKVIHSWYLTPYKLSKFYPSQSVLCWRKCGESGTLCHILWSCISLRSYWNKIFSIMSDICSRPIVPHPELAILHLNIHKFLPKFRVVIIQFLLAAKITITRKWNTIDPPNPSDAILTLNCQCEMEKLLAITNLSLTVFRDKWEPWLSNPRCTVKI